MIASAYEPGTMIAELPLIGNVSRGAPPAVSVPTVCGSSFRLGILVENGCLRYLLLLARRSRLASDNGLWPWLLVGTPLWFRLQVRSLSQYVRPQTVLTSNAGSTSRRRASGAAAMPTRILN